MTTGPCATSVSARPLFPSDSALALLLALVLVNLVMQPLTEPDFGWHLRTGLDLIQQGGRLPDVDPYSHTMPDWSWVEHAWLTDLLIGLLYSAGGTLPVILFFGLVTAGAWLTASWCSQASASLRLLGCSLSLWVALPFLGARTQMVTLLGLATLMWMLARVKRGRVSVVWWIPPFFLLWANLHGGFAAGLFFLALVISLSWILVGMSSFWPSFLYGVNDEFYAPHVRWQLLTASISGGLLTLINPYGWNLHKEIVDSLSDRFMIDMLQEWHAISLDTLAGRLFASYLAGMGLAMISWYRRIEPVRWGVLAVFLFLACRHLRNIPIFLIVSLPLMVELLQDACVRLGTQSLFIKLRPIQWSRGATFALGLFLLYFGPDHLQRVWRFGSEPAVAFRQTSYPIEAVEWIQAHRDRVGTRLLHDYQYGGFLLWWLPNEKIFIDGRMPAWRIDDRRIFKDYLDARESDPPRLAVLDKYSIDWILIRRDSILARTLVSLPLWRKEYEDTKVVIYTKTREGVEAQGGYFTPAGEEASGRNARSRTRWE